MSDDFSWIQFSMGSPDSIKEPVFSEPWEADTFAMLVTLEKQNLIFLLFQNLLHKIMLKNLLTSLKKLFITLCEMETQQ